MITVSSKVIEHLPPGTELVVFAKHPSISTRKNSIVKFRTVLKQHERIDIIGIPVLIPIREFQHNTIFRLPYKNEKSI